MHTHFRNHNAYDFCFPIVNNKINTLESVGLKTYFYFSHNMNIRILEQLRASIYHLTIASTKEEIFEDKGVFKEANLMTT